MAEAKTRLAFLTAREREIVRAFARDVKTALRADLWDMKLFGSKARGRAGPESDIDILVVIRSKDRRAREKVISILVDHKLATGVFLAPIIYTRREYERSRRLGSPFIAAVEEEGIAL